MPTECVFTLPSGNKCRCVATRGHAFCRHHGAPSQPRPDLDLWNRLSCWRSLSRNILEDPLEELPSHMLTLFQALLENQVSDRFAARSLRILLQRLGAIPLVIDPAFGQTPAAPPPPMDHPSASGDEGEAERLLQWALSVADAELARSQPPAAHSRPPAPSLAVSR